MFDENNDGLISYYEYRRRNAQEKAAAAARNTDVTTQAPVTVAPYTISLNPVDPV